MRPVTDAGGEQHRQADFESRHAVRDPVEGRALAVHLLALRIVVAIGRVVGGEDVEHAALQPTPDVLLVRLVAGRRAAHVLGALEALAVEVGGGEEEVLRAGLGVEPEPARLGGADLLDRRLRGDMHDQDRQVDDLGERDRPVGGLALGLGRVGDRVELRG